MLFALIISASAITITANALLIRHMLDAHRNTTAEPGTPHTTT